MPVSNKVLIVDDDANLLAGLLRILRGRFNVVGVTSGKEALAKVADAGPFAVILSDMRMPGMDGLELLRYMQDLAPDSVRMMLTGNPDQKTAVEAINSGKVFHFFIKPSPIKDLISGIEAGLQQYTLNLSIRKHLPKQDRVKRLSSRLEEFRKSSPAEINGLPVHYYVINLAPIGKVIPQQWPNVRDKAIAIAEGIITAGMKQGDSFRDLGDDVFIVILPSLNSVDGAVRVHSICENICTRLLGAEFISNANSKMILRSMQDVIDNLADEPSEMASEMKKIILRSKQDLIESVTIDYLPVWHSDCFKSKAIGHRLAASF